MRHTTQGGTEMGNGIVTLLGGAAAGALLMYWLDPERGGARRARSMDAVRTAGTRTSGALAGAWHDTEQRLESAGERLRGTARAAVDALRPERTAARAQHGEAPAATSAATAAAAAATRHAGQRVREAMRSGPDGAWAPAVRHSALAGGALLAALGLVRRSPLGLAIGLAGAALLARGATNAPLGAALRSRVRQLGFDQPVDVEQSVYIDAAPEDVYDFWIDCENFPHFMPHVVDVRDLGRRRSHWVVQGPGGSHFSWNSVITEQSRPQRLAWRSEPGADIPQSGSVGFAPQRGGTLVTVRISYTPPAGALGQGLATLLGADPQARLAQDLAQLKTHLEQGGLPPATAHAHAPGRYLH